MEAGGVGIEANCGGVIVGGAGAGANCGSCLDMASSLLEAAHAVRELPFAVLQEAA